MEAATWLADRGFDKPAPVRGDDVPGIGDFTIVINDQQDDDNPNLALQAGLTNMRLAVSYCVLCH